MTVNGEGSTPAASITATSRNPNVTSVSTNNELTITAVASQTSFTVSERVTIADDINLLFSAGAGDLCVQLYPGRQPDWLAVLWLDC